MPNSLFYFCLEINPKAGALLLVEAHKKLPLNEQYVRCVKTHRIENNKVFEFVVCMSEAMSGHLMNAVHVSIDQCQLK